MSLADSDPEVADLVEREKNRQWRGIELIASEVCLSRDLARCARSLSLSAQHQSVQSTILAREHSRWFAWRSFTLY
jgi:hypothetical protein